MLRRIEMLQWRYSWDLSTGILEYEYEKILKESSENDTKYLKPVVVVIKNISFHSEENLWLYGFVYIK